MGKIQDDLKKGLEAEKRVKPTLERLFGALNKTEDKFNNFDFYNDKYYVEHKQRYIPFGKFDSLIFDKVKYDKYLELKEKNPKLQFFVVWSLQDDIYMWKMNEDTSQYYIKHDFYVDRITHKQTTRTICVRNEFISPFSDFQVVIKKKKKLKKLKTTS